MEWSSPQFLLDKLESLLIQVRERHGVRASLARFTSVLAQYPCIARCLRELTPNGDREPVDAFYLERHDFLVRLLVNKLMVRLRKEGIRAEIKSELRTKSGTGDVDIIPENPPNFRVRIEVKGGQGIGIDQNLRYVAENSVLILCLAGRGEALLINRNKLRELLSDYLGNLVDKAELLLDGADEKSPGPWCAGCPLECPHARKKSSHKPNLEEEFLAQTKNWLKAVNKTVELAIKIIKEAEKTNQRKKKMTEESGEVGGENN